MKILCLIISIFSFQSTFSQIMVKDLDKNSLPKNIRWVGKLYKAVSWLDKAGTNIVILTNTGKIKSKNISEEGYYDEELHASHFLISGDTAKKNWKVYDNVLDCPLDLVLNFIPNTFTVTDLNNDGFGEVWIMYKSSCTGDVSPNSLKIIMYENNKKYAVRGNTRVKLSENNSIGGEFVIDDAFKKGNSSIRKFAENLWKKNNVETWE